jgi:hypothetical protein
MKETKVFLIALILAFGFAMSASAAVLNFDDLPQQNEIIPYLYGGFNWYNFGSLPDYNTDGSATGYAPSVVTPHNVAFNGGGTFASLAMTSLFTFNGAYLTSQGADQVAITGFAGTDIQYSQTITLSGSATWFQFDWSGIDKLTFTPSNPGGWFGMDNFTYDSASPVAAPEPATLLLLSLGLASIAGGTWRKL